MNSPYPIYMKDSGNKFFATSTIILIFLLLVCSGCQQQKNKDNTHLNRETQTLYVGYSNNSYYKTIQEALNNSIDGDLIRIENGTYNELLTINTSINLIGLNKNITIIQYMNKDTHGQYTVITINADHCKIENLRITTNMSGLFAKGIYINSSNNTINNNYIEGITEGIYFTKNSENNIITNNTIMNNQYGLNVILSKNNTLSHNIFTSNTLDAVHLLNDANNNIISNNIFSDNNYGIRIQGSTNNKIFENCIQDNEEGAYCCCGAYYNEFYSNTFKNNLYFNAKESPDLTNFWYNYTTSVGNYWDKYTGVDQNKDGFGDTPFTIPEATDKDMCPLINPPTNTLCK